MTGHGATRQEDLSFPSVCQPRASFPPRLIPILRRRNGRQNQGRNLSEVARWVTGLPPPLAGPPEGLEFAGRAVQAGSPLQALGRAVASTPSAFPLLPE